MTADELQERLVVFAVRILHLADALPETAAGRHVRNQIVRCGTSPAPNYSEARGAESRADFFHKLRIVFKELNETQVWLLIILQAKLLKEDRIKDIADENIQLCKIVATAVSSAKRTKLKASSPTPK